MKKHITYLIALLVIGCESNIVHWTSYDEKQEIEKNSNSKIKKLQYKRIQSISTDKNELIKGFKKDVLNKIHGGGATDRKRKLLEKQKKGKVRSKQFGRVEIPQEAFIGVLKISKEK